MHWAGQPSGRIGRGGAIVDMSETRWIVPVKPYVPPKTLAERTENAILMGVGVAAVAFGFLFIILSAMG